MILKSNSPEDLPAQESPPPATPAAGEPVKTTAAELVGGLAADMPVPTAPGPGDVQPELFGGPEDTAEPGESTPPPVNAIKDRAGNVWDPTVYKTDDKGAPRLDKRGHFIPVTKGRKPGTKNNTSPENSDSSAPKLTAGQASNDSGTPDEFDNAAALYFDVGCGALTTALSEEWQPENEGERAGMIRAVAAYLRAKGDVEITPGQALCFALVVYAGKRVNKPKTKERLILIWLKIRNLFNRNKQQIKT